MGLARKKDDLSFEPSLHEALTDPVIQAVMDRDGVSQDELVRLIIVARARLSLPEEAVILPFPARRAPAAERPSSERPSSEPEVELRPKTRWPFSVRAGAVPQKS